MNDLIIIEVLLRLPPPSPPPTIDLLHSPQSTSIHPNNIQLSQNYFLDIYSKHQIALKNVILSSVSFASLSSSSATCSSGQLTDWGSVAAGHGIIGHLLAVVVVVVVESLSSVSSSAYLVESSTCKWASFVSFIGLHLWMGGGGNSKKEGNLSVVVSPKSTTPSFVYNSC